MREPTTYDTGPKDRVYMRIPVKIKAVILVDNHTYAKVTIKDLSATGLSFTAQLDKKIPDACDIVFRLPRSLRKIKIGLEVKNRFTKEGSSRIGCRFDSITSKDEKYISGYIQRSTEFHPACVMFSVAAFFLFLDAILRIFTWMASMYYKEAHVEYAFVTYDWCVYGVSLLIYAAAGFMACIYSCDIKKKRFVISLFCGGLAFIFMLTKYLFYIKLCLWSSAYLPIKIFFWAESLIIAYTVCSASFFTMSLKKIDLVANTIGSYQKTFREDKDK